MRRSIRALTICALVVFSGYSGCTCPTGVNRPGSVFDGSARWAVGLAQPRIAAFAGDAVLRQIIGTRIGSDGRLFTNVGSWGVIAFSPSRRETIQVNVSADGSMTQSTQEAASAGVQVPLPPGWINSPDAFTLARSRVPAFDEAALVVFNFTDFGGELAGKATWGITTPGGNVLVLFDGSVVRLQ